MGIKQIRIDSINIGKRFRCDDGDLDALAASIKQLGLLQPIVVTPHPTGGYLLIAGKRRVSACQKLGWSMIDARVVDMPDRLTRLLAERDENEMHKPFTVSERVAIGKAVEEAMGERRGRPSKDEPASENGDNCPTFDGQRTRDVAATAAGFTTGKQYERAKEVVEHGSKEIIAAMDAGEIKISAAAKHVREVSAAVKERTKKKGDGKAGKKGKGTKTKEALLPFPNDDKIDQILEEAVAALEARAKAFGMTPELKALIDDQDAVLARWHEFAGKPAPEQEIVPDELDTPEFRKLWDEWKAYRKEIKHRLSPTTRGRQLKELAGYGHDDAIKSIETSMTKGWHGLFPPEERKQKPTAGLYAGMAEFAAKGNP